VERYLALKLTDEQTNSFSSVIDGAPVFDITKFWFDPSIQAQFPLLCRVAIGILSALAALAVSECSVWPAESWRNGAANYLVVQWMLYGIHSVML
jgi:hypothetical protein